MAQEKQPSENGAEIFFAPIEFAPIEISRWGQVLKLKKFE
jgi:hypothetical protein